MALERFDYSDGLAHLTGWLARPACTPRGAIVIYPTIMNVSAPIERRAALLAQAGFLALIADFYGTPVTDFAQARELADELRADIDGYRHRIGAGIAALRALAGDLTLSAIGYCMGGQAVLEAARAGENLALVASFHGILSTDRPATAETPIAPRILISHGDADPLVPRAQVLAFWEEMDAAGGNWHFHSYAGVKHGFTDPGSDARGMPAIGYDASADRQSWAALLGLLDEIYG
jgi:dienelactone hydrolase